ncbi:MAG: ferrochelatase [Alphaproteobacteria bacterium]|nr:ferrochelatase [Alphaproteobacteria bacterium]
MSRRRLAVVLMNLGGPDNPDSVRPFLFNLFNDPAILELPAPLRQSLAWVLARRRAPVAREAYARIGGRSPLLENTQAQARALERELSDLGDARAFVAMRYWHPLTGETARAVAAWNPTEVVLLPLYPQFSGTTSGSSLKCWHAAAAACGIAAPTRAVCCYPEQPGFVAAAADLIEQALQEAAKRGKPRLLLSAHGLPKKTVARGDPYQSQIERSAAAIVQAVGRRDNAWQDVEHVVCYQSRVGPLEWLGPYTDAEITRAARDGRPIVLFPLAFVSEHSETLVELDIDYRHIAEARGAPAYLRVATVGAAQVFIRGLATVIRDALARPAATASSTGARVCPRGSARCAMQGAAP